MKKILAIVCLIAECDYGMEVPREADITDAVPREVLQNTEQSLWETDDDVTLGITESTSRNIDLSLTEETDDSLQEACERWRMETVMRRFSLPIMITSAIFPVFLNYASEMVERDPESVSKGLKYCSSISEFVSIAVLSLLLWYEARYFYYNILPSFRNRIANA